MKIEKMNPREEFLSQPVWVRAVAALAAAAFVAYYVPTLIVTLTGQWKNNLTYPLAILVGMVGFLIQNLIGVAVKRPILVGYVFAVVWFVTSVASILMTKRLENWRYWWPVLFANESGSILNAFVLVYLAKRMIPTWETRFRNR